MQYIPHLVAAGLEVEITSFFDDAYLEALYEKKHKDNRVLGCYKRRLAKMRAARESDVFWIEKEALPWLPWAVERRLLPQRVPIVSDYDDALFHRYDLHRNPVVRAVLGRKIDGVMAGSSLVTAGNEYLANRARAAGATWIEIVPTVVDADTYQPLSSIDSDERARIGWIGTPQTWNKYGAPMEHVFRRVAADTGAMFRLVGASQKKKTEGCFEFIPWSEATEVSSIQRMDIGVMPLIDDPWEWGKCGYKLIQYMACGLPVVASPVGVNRTIVEHGVNGFLVETENDWREAIRVLLSDEKLRIRMGTAGRRKVVSTFSIAAQGPRVASLLEKVASTPAG